MALRFSSTSLKLCIGSMDAVCAALLDPPLADDKSRRQTIPNLSPEMPFCQARQSWLAENGRSL
jgi:hypothetical protein